MFELHHFEYFDSIEIGLIKGDDKKPFNINGLNQSLICEINFSLGKAILRGKGNSLQSSQSFPIDEYQFYIKISNIGNFISLNPFYVNSKVDNVWSINLENSVQNQMDEFTQYLYLQSLGTEVVKMIKDKDMIVLSYEDKPIEIKSIIFDETLNILAFKANEKSIEKFSKENSCFKFIPNELLREALYSKDKMNPLYQFLTKNYKNLFEFKSENLEFFLNKNRISSQNIKSITKSCESNRNDFELKYLPAVDRLIVSDKCNKIQLLADKTEQGDFITSPFMFTKYFIQFYLLKEENDHLIEFLDFKKISSELIFTLEEINQFKKFFKCLENSQHVLSDDLYVYYSIPMGLIKIFIRKTFEFVQLLVDGTKTYQNPDIIDNPQSNSDSDTDSDNIVDLAWLFNVVVEDKKQNLKEVPKNVLNHYENFPSEFDTILSVLFRIEESLYLQSNSYRKEAKSVSRGNTSFNRLFSFLNSKGSIKYDIEKLLDFGLYVNSSFMNEFMHYKYQNQPFEDFTSEDYSEEDYLEKIKVNLSLKNQTLVKLAYSITNQPFLEIGAEIRDLFLLKNGEYLAVYTKNNHILIYTTKFGFGLISDINLGQKMTWDNKELFPLNRDNIKIVQKLMKLEEKSDKITQELPKLKQPLPKKQKDTPNINKDFLDTLYNMGFSIQDSQKALKETKSTSLDAAINLIFQYKADKKDKPSKSIPQNTNLVIKPEWQCEVCTLINDTTKIPIINVCDACGNTAGPSAYIELTEVVKTKPEKTTAPKVVKSSSTIQSRDTVIDCEMIELKFENLLNGKFLILNFKREDRHHMMIIRLAYSKQLILSSVIRNPTNGNLCSLFGKKMLTGFKTQKNLGEFINNEFHEEFHQILPLVYRKKFMVQSGRVVYSLEKNQNLQKMMISCQNSPNSRDSETILITAQIYYQKHKTFNFKEFVLTNKSHTYESNEFTFEPSNTKIIEFKNLKKSFTIDNRVFLVQDNIINRINLNQQMIDIVHGSDKTIKNIIRVSKDEFCLINESNETKILTNKDLLANLEILDAPTESLRKQTSYKDSKLDAKSFLNLFLVQDLMKYSIESKSDCLLNRDSCYIVCAKPIKNQSTFGFDIVLDQKKDIISLDIDIYIKLKKDHEIVKRLQAQKNIKLKSNIINSDNQWSDLPLKTVNSQGFYFSKAIFESNCLSKKNPSSFNTKYPFNLFVFTNFYEQRMKISKLILKLNDSSKKVCSKFLVFIFESLSQANDFENY